MKLNIHPMKSLAALTLLCIAPHVWGQEQTTDTTGTSGATRSATEPMATEPMAQTLSEARAAEYQATLKDIRQTLGSVPKFVSTYPKLALPGVWRETKSLMLNPQTALSMRVKTLIASAVNAQTPCERCTYLDQEFAKVHGASSRDIQEAVTMASLTRHWSTFLNGLQLDDTSYRREVTQIMEFTKRRMTQQAGVLPTAEQQTSEAPQQYGESSHQHMEQEPGTAAPRPKMISTPQEAYEDIENTLGIMPEFLRKFPEEGIVGAWKAMKNFQLNPETQLTSKEKELIGLAVAAQIPCRYCVTFHTEAAKLHGATIREVNESLAVSGVTRQLSTVFNAPGFDEKSFRSDVRRMTQYMRKQMTPSKQLGGEAPPTEAKKGKKSTKSKKSKTTAPSE